MYEKDSFSLVYFGVLAHHSYAAEWSRLKAFIILLVATVLMSLVAEVIVDNIQSILGSSGVSEVEILNFFLNKFTLLFF